MRNDGYSYVSEYNGEKILDDPNLRTEEKEVFIYMLHTEGEAVVESDKSTIIRHLLKHDESEIEELRKYNGKIVGGSLRIPIGCLKIRKSSRNRNLLSRVVSR